MVGYAARVSEVIRELRGASYQGFEFIEPDGGKRRDWKAVRGNGTLTLTPTELRFARWVPEKEWAIPLASVIGVERGRSHNGKWSGVPVVKVRFADAAGERIFGVIVGRRKEADAWVQTIRAAMAGRAGQSRSNARMT